MLCDFFPIIFEEYINPMKLFIPLFFLLICSSCETSDGVTDSNYSFKYIVNEEGASPQVGDLVKFSEVVYLNGKEISSTKELGLKEIILPAEAVLTKPLPPNYEMLFQMSIGDSVEVIQKLKDLKNLPKGYTTKDQLKYVIKLIDITPQDEVKSPKKKDKTSSNYPFEIFYQSGNITAQPGDRIRYREYRYINNELESETPMHKPLQAFLPARNTIPDPPPGNYEALLLGGIGDSLQLDQLLVGVKGLPKNLKASDTINYVIQILDILTPGEYEIEKVIKKAKAQQLKDETMARKEKVEKSTLALIDQFKKGELEDDLIYTHSGLKYLLHEKGTGKETSPLEKVKVQYMGFLPDGKVFESTFEDGKPFQFPLGAGKVIKGWEEGISKLTVGSKATFFVPYQLAYGRAGWFKRIPRKADLVFYIELLDAQ